MSKQKNLLFYIGIIVGFGALMYLITQKGTALEAGDFAPSAQRDFSTPFQHFTDSFKHNLVHPLSILILLKAPGL